ncbi:MAG: ASKHA domain-containing protein [Methanoregula sp.]|nr:ASKHA domain-containing protein [Methanoregula sp.]
MNKMATVSFTPVNRQISVPKGTTVLAAIRQAAILFESICGGKGECSKCKVIFVQGLCDAGSPLSIQGLNAEEIKNHYCRACHTHIQGDCEFIIPVESRIFSPRILMNVLSGKTDPAPSVIKYRLLPDNDAAHPASSRSLRLEGYTGTRPQMTKEQHDRLLHATEAVTVAITRSHHYPEVIAIEEGDTRKETYGLALDLGTTTVVGMLVDLLDGSILAKASSLNRQITLGEELLTRIHAGKKHDGKITLQRLAVESINAVIDPLIASAGVDRSSIYDVCIGGNTVMEYLLVGKESHDLELVNTVVSRKPIVIRAHLPGIAVHPEAYVYCLPNVSRFVGGDAVGDVVASGMQNSEDLSLMIDLGTNGEVVLGNSHWLASVSCASGPAFEGAGVSSGMRAMQGAIESVTIDPGQFIVSVTTVEETPPRGICGSGLIDAAAAMAQAGILDFTGKIVDGKPGVRTAPEGLEYVLVPKDRTATGRDIVITAQDMAYLMDSKAAVLGSIGVLLKKYRISVGEIKNVYLAGAFGTYANPKNIVRFGIIPDFYNATFHGIGNGSLSGAYAALISGKKRVAAQDVADKMVYIDLLCDADFIEEYSSAIYIPGKPEYFPR